MPEDLYVRRRYSRKFLKNELLSMYHDTDYLIRKTLSYAKYAGIVFLAVLVWYLLLKLVG